jgi:hypothetical protein
MPRSTLHCQLAQEKFRRSLRQQTPYEMMMDYDSLYACHVAFVDAVDSWILKQPPEVIESFNKKIKRKVEVKNDN